MASTKIYRSLMLLLFLSGPALGGEAGTDVGITVTGVGEVMTQPDSLEILLQSVGAGELSSDALTRQKTTRQRIVDAFEQLKLPGLKLEVTGLRVNSGDNSAPGNIVVNGNPPPVKSTISITADLRVLVTGIDKLKEDEIADIVSKLLDTAKDSGAQLSTNSATNMIARIYGQNMATTAVTFVAQDISDAREKAAKAAFEQAKDRAERIAKTAGVSVGGVSSLQESLEPNMPGESSRMNRVMLAIYGNNMLDTGESNDRRMTSEKFGPIPVRVTVRARFDIHRSTSGKD